MPINVHEFIRKWSQTSLTERSASQQHFLDLCELVGHPKPAEADPEGDTFTFEKGAAKYGGGSGWADVWKRGFFAWEYKRRHADLAAAYDQLLRYREALENPPLLVVCDMDRLVVHTNFTGRPAVVHDIPLKDLGKPESLEILRAVFYEPKKLEPGTTREGITQDAAKRFADIAQTMRARGLPAHDVAHFLDRVVFCLFAEDVNLLPEKIFTRLIRNSDEKPELFTRFVGELFNNMAHGGFWGADKIRHFNGNLFINGPILTPTRDELWEIRRAARLDWSAIDPSVFGTLFERGMNPDKRSQLGAHYTSREDIETLVEPVVMQPLKREWAKIRQKVESVLAKAEPPASDRTRKKALMDANLLLKNFWNRLSQVKVLDPACGSGNFLYVTLQKLKDLEKEVILYAMDQGFPGLLPQVGPWQFYGIEINPYAFELAQMSVWIGYLQWIRDNGFGEPDDPVLKPMNTFQNEDAILDLSDPENPKEPEWPAVDFIVGNPPFLGNKLMRSLLGDQYVEKLWQLYGPRIPATSDLCCYWFEKAREAIRHAKVNRAGLLATQAIRGGANREVLLRIQQSGDIFFAVSDRPWILEGANVHVSMVGFDDGTETTKVLDGHPVPTINPDLTYNTDVTRSRPLAHASGIAFIGVSMHGPFDIEPEEALRMLLANGNPHGKPNSDVVLPILNAAQVLQRLPERWVIYFPVDIPEREAALYEQPFEYVRKVVKPVRDQNRRSSYREKWWLHGEPRTAMVEALRGYQRYLGTPRIAKHRIFLWLDLVNLPSDQIVAFARSDDYVFGVLQSHVHEVWARAQGTQLRERESGFRYTPTTIFQTFPQPHSSPSQVSSIAAAAKELDDLRNRWLNPPEWTREEILEFPGSVNGPWARYIHDPDERGIGTVRYPRLVPRDDEVAENLKKRTLTNLYNQRPTWLDLAHKRLDEAVFAAYGWDPGISDEEILKRLLALNLERAAAEGSTLSGVDEEEE